MTLSFSDYEIDVERRELRRAETLVHVEPQVFDLLVYLMENRNRVVSKEDLIASVCPRAVRRTIGARPQ